MALEHVGLRAEPDVVVLCVYTDDFRRVFPFYSGVGYRIPHFRLRSGELVAEPFPEPAVWDYSRLVVALRRALQRDEDVTFAFDLNEAILDRFLKLAEPHAFLPVIMFLPGTADTHVDQERRGWLRRFASRRDVPFLDLTDTLLFETGPHLTFIPNNWHLNPLGHEIVASRLEELLAREVLEADDAR